MNEEQKEQLKEKVHGAAVQGAKKTAEQVKTATGWKKWLWVALTALLAGLACLTQVGCGRITPEQVQGAHHLYHAVSGKPCVFVVESCK